MSVPTSTVVEQKEEDKMMNLIRQHRTNELLGQTQEGRDFCVKALHPASELISSPGIPDSYAGAVTVLRYGQITSTDASALSGTSATYDVEVLLFKHPVVFGCIKITDGTVTSYGTVVNANIVPAGSMSPAFTATKVARGLYEMCETYRCVFSSCTAHLDAPATASQGTVVAVQYADRPIKFGGALLSNSATPTNSLMLDSKVMGWRQYKDYSYLVQMPGAYVSPATAGCYMPLILDDFQFKTTQAKVQLTDGQTATAMNMVFPPVGGSSTAVGMFYSGSVGFPYGNGSSLTGPSGVGWSDFLALPDRCGDIIGHMVFKGISKQAKVVFNWREGFEAVMQPGGTYSMFQKLSPRTDPLSLEAYQVVRRELSGAYPESYNAFGALLSTIGSIAATYIPKLIGWIQKKHEQRKALRASTNVAAPVKAEARQAAKAEVKKELKQKIHLG